MGDRAGDHVTDWAERPAGAPAARTIAHGDGWSVSEVTCRLGPRDRPLEEQHDQVTIAAVVEGMFRCRTDTGEALLYPGAFLLGNAGACFECAHDQHAGGRCIAFQFEPSFVEEVAAAVAGSHLARFPAAMLPAIRELALPAVEAQINASTGNQAALHEFAVRLAEIVLMTLSGGVEPVAMPSSKEQRRIGDVLHSIEQHAEQPLELDGLARVALMSKYHFLRTFRRAVGITPYQFLLGVRMRRAAVGLRTTPMPIAAIALDAGFGDLSTFNHGFRKAFGMNPGAFRARACR